MHVFIKTILSMQHMHINMDKTLLLDIFRILHIIRVLEQKETQ